MIKVNYYLALFLFVLGKASFIVETAFRWEVNYLKKLEGRSLSDFPKIYLN